MGRKNKRKKTEYRNRLGFNPRKYVKRYCPLSNQDSPSRLTSPSSPSSPSNPSNPSNPSSPAFLRHTWNEERRSPCRGDIWFADLGDHPGTSVQGGCRPVFIVSNDIGNEHAETLNVLPMTRQLKKPGLPCHTELSSSAVIGKHQEVGKSMVLAEQITTISKTQLRKYVGRVADAALLTDIDTAIGRQLNLARYEMNHQSDRTEEIYSNEQ